MKKIVLLILWSLFISMTWAQQVKEHVVIHNFRNSVVIDLERGREDQISQHYFTDYGDLVRSLASSEMTSRYLFQGQEYDFYLKLHHLRDRMYCSEQKHFLQPDPASQYYSPYLFVNSDPVNIIDLDGMAGKPIVFYQEEVASPNGISESMADLMHDIPNAHYIPMRELVEERVGPISDWNGCIFLKGHMSTTKGSEITIETMPEGARGRTRSLLTKETVPEGGEKSVVMDAKQFGRQLRVFANKNPLTNVESIVAGGCQGAVAGEGISKGFTDKSLGKSQGRRVKILGLKKGKYAAFVGKKTTSDPTTRGFESSRFYSFPNAKSPLVAKTERPKKRDILDDYVEEDGKGGVRPKEYATTSEIEGFYSGERRAGAPFDDVSLKWATY